MAKKAWEARIPEEVPHKIAVHYGRDYGLDEEIENLDALYMKIQDRGCHNVTDTQCDICLDDQKEYRRLYNDIMTKV